MRKYSSYLNEISATELYDGLLGHGLFAEKIPDCFTSESFLLFAKSRQNYWNSKPKDYVRYQSMRNTNIPRPLAIPEPFAYSDQCRVLANNWGTIKEYFASKTDNNEFKISRIHIRKLVNNDRLFEMNYKNFNKDDAPEDVLIIPSKFIAYADISNCFPSIYSHAIPWALIGKDAAKLRREEKKEYFNLIDHYSMNVKYGETNGLLIGPHSSNLISEIILVNIDNRLSDRYKYIRNIDDYTCYADSYEQAESFLLDLTQELKVFELAINSKKSKILALPNASIKNWTSKLSQFTFVDTYIEDDVEYIKTSELKRFMDLAVELTIKEDSDVSIIKYAIKIISKKNLGKNAKLYYMRKIHHLVLLFPYLMHVLDLYVFDCHKISTNYIRNIAIDLYRYGIKKKFYEASSYAIFWSLKYEIDPDFETIIDDSIASNDCVLLVLSYLYDMRFENSTNKPVFEKHARVLMINDFDRYWVFIYEVLGLSDFTGNYKQMKKKDISFIKSEYLKNGVG